MTETAVFGGGCFWCLEAIFRALKGVVSVRSGYCGGALPDPGYEAVCGGGTGHAEVVEIVFDPRQIGYVALLDCFFSAHDPTTLNRQGNDIGTQYRSVIFSQSETQKQLAKACVAALNDSNRCGARVVTQVEDASPFYPAETYHQDYFARNPAQAYCAVVIAPKLAKFFADHPLLLRDDSGWR